MNRSVWTVAAVGLAVWVLVVLALGAVAAMIVPDGQTVARGPATGSPSLTPPAPGATPTARVPGIPAFRTASPSEATPVPSTPRETPVPSAPRETPVPFAPRETPTSEVPTAQAGPAAPTRVPGTTALSPAVDWPVLPEVDELEPQLITPHFAVYAAQPGDAFLAGLVAHWGPQLEGILAAVSGRLGRSLPVVPVHVVFDRAYEARCPARGLARPDRRQPLITVYADEDTPPLQIGAVLAHEMAHQLTADGRFVGDGILAEGIANWAAGEMALAWQGYASWEDAVLDYLDHRQYVPLADDIALNPRPGENCLERRDRVYNTRTAFVDWLIGQLGLERVLAMPYWEVPERDPTTGEVVRDSDTGRAVMNRRPDYRAATGYDLPTLELLWLLELATRR